MTDIKGPEVYLKLSKHVYLFYFIAYSFKCYQCDGKGKEYTTKQCEKDQTKIECHTNFTCYKLHGTTLDGIESEARGCWTKDFCEGYVKLCKEETDEQKRKRTIKDCEAACCVSDGDTPCNGGFTVSINMIMIMFAVLCSLKIS